MWFIFMSKFYVQFGDGIRKDLGTICGSYLYKYWNNQIICDKLNTKPTKFSTSDNTNMNTTGITIQDNTRFEYFFGSEHVALENTFQNWQMPINTKNQKIQKPKSDSNEVSL